MSLLTFSLVVALAACYGASRRASGRTSCKLRRRPPAEPARAPCRTVSARSTTPSRSILDRVVADSAFPGAIAVIGNHRGPARHRHRAAISTGHRRPAPDANTLWDLASLTKVVGMTSAMMQLVERGKVDLDAPVQRYLPEWTGPNKDRSRCAT